jgi:CheY-like chemotaxis protein
LHPTAEINKPTVLLVEDSEDDAYFFGRTLRRSGATCALHHARDGEAALAFLRKAIGSQTLPQIIFLDLKMPLMNGFEALEWMRQQPELSGVPVVVLSGSEREDDVSRAREQGAAEYLVKPLRVADLSRLLGEICRGAGAEAGQKIGAHS